MTTRAPVSTTRATAASAPESIERQAGAPTVPLAHAGTIADASLTARSGTQTGYAPTVTPTALDAGVDAALPQAEPSFIGRYEPLDLLGEGGMGEVRLYRDRWVGREVAVKIIRKGQGSRSDMRARFLREARVQGQLEHPSLVPVYDLGVHPESGAFFTMKRVRGLTLEQILEEHKKGNGALLEEYSTRRLLTAFSSVCLAVHYAHARGVVHRDLKPGNIMLGGFGEVYVLDWGLAKLSGVTDPELGKAVEVPHASGQTAADAVMGTPGYMPPEQLLGSDVDARADVYALGAILFEILTLDTLHPLGTIEETISSTARGADARAATRAPSRDIAPELEDVCVRATARDRDERYTTARDLADAVERYLDGDRDVAHRRAMVDAHVARARENVEAALTKSEGAAQSRATAMSEIGKALALDPQSPAALELLVRLFSELPREVPLEAQREIDEERTRAIRTIARGGTFAYLSWFLWLPLVLAMGLRDLWGMGIATTCLVIAASVSWWVSYSGTRRILPVLLTLVSSSAAIAITSRVFGPYVIVPTIGLANMLTFAMHGDRVHRASAATLTIAAIFAPAALEWMGIISPSYTFENGLLHIHPHAVSFDNPMLTCLLLASATLGLTLAPLWLVGWTRMKLTRYEREAHLRAWHLRQLIPKAAQLESTAPPSNEVKCLTDLV